MKSVLISIQPQWCELIANGKKTIEVRKTAPKEVPFKAYIYQTKKRWIYKLLPWLEERQGKVIGEFICDKVICCQAYYGNSGEKHLTNLFGIELTQMCLTEDELFNYIVGNKKEGEGRLLHISKLKIYDKPKELGEFRKPCVDEYQYCQGCRYGHIVISPDEEEYALYHGGCFESFDTVCLNRITRPPQSWMYVENYDNE